MPGSPTMHPYTGQRDYMVVSLNYCSQNGGNLYRAPYYNGNPNIGPRIIGNLDQYPYAGLRVQGLGRESTNWHYAHFWVEEAANLGPRVPKFGYEWVLTEGIYYLG